MSQLENQWFRYTKALNIYVHIYVYMYICIYIRLHHQKCTRHVHERKSYDNIFRGKVQKNDLNNLISTYMALID